MTDDEKIALAKAAIRILGSIDNRMALRWNRNSWDYAFYEIRFRVGISLEEREPDPSAQGFVVVREGDTPESVAESLAQILTEQGWGKPWLISREAARKRDRNLARLDDGEERR